MSKLYRQDQTSVFSLDDDDDGKNKNKFFFFFFLLHNMIYLETISSSKQYESPKLVDMESWFLRGDILYKYECDHFDENDKTHSR